VVTRLEGEVIVLVGNPRPESRTLKAGVLIAKALVNRDPDLVIDLATIGVELLDPESRRVTELVERLKVARVLVVATPTYKGAYTGLLKLFLDRFAAGALSDVVAVPVMLGASSTHALAVEVFLKPVLVEIGASCPGPGLFLIDSSYDDLAQVEDALGRTRAAMSRSS
jgi:FMN reductase